MIADQTKPRVLYTLKYREGTKYGDLFPHWRFGVFSNESTGDAVRRQCQHPEQVEVVVMDG